MTVEEWQQRGGGGGGGSGNNRREWRHWKESNRMGCKTNTHTTIAFSHRKHCGAITNRVNCNYANRQFRFEFTSLIKYECFMHYGQLNFQNSLHIAPHGIITYIEMQRIFASFFSMLHILFMRIVFFCMKIRFIRRILLRRISMQRKSLSIISKIQLYSQWNLNFWEAPTERYGVWILVSTRMLRLCLHFSIEMIWTYRYQAIENFNRASPFKVEQRHFLCGATHKIRFLIFSIYI